MHDDVSPEQRLAQLGQTLFAALPHNCGNEATPGHDETERWRDWSQRNTTKDQVRIEAFIAPLLRPDTRILHVGLGNSRLAQSFHTQVALIVGITITPQEYELARALRFPNYQPLLMNKYSSAFAAMPGCFDLIIDNNPSTFGCCHAHFSRMMLAYRRMLAIDGLIVSDKLGLGHVADLSNSHSRWGFSPEDWLAIAKAIGLHPAQQDSYILTMQKA